LAYSFDLTRGECSLNFEWIKKQWSLPEFHAMQSRLDPKSSRPVVEFLEGRSLLSGFKPLVPSGLRPAMIGQIDRTTEPGNNISNVASFAPESSMIPIGVLKSVSATR
jgi:hypothetical protein